MLIEMGISMLAVDPASNAPFVVLKEPGGTVVLPIWIGIFEASAIASEMEKLKAPRPLTHDLLKGALDGLDAHLLRVEIVDLRDNTFYAQLVLLSAGGKEVTVDARPSDAIALALRMNSKIFVNDVVIEKSKASHLPTGGADGNLTKEDKDKWLEVLKSLSSEAFGKYKQ